MNYKEIYNEKFGVKHTEPDGLTKQLFGMPVKDDSLDKRQFMLDMLTLSKTQNFEIAYTLKKQSEMLKELAEIANSIGYIKQEAVNKIDGVAKKNEITWDINKDKVYTLVIKKENEDG